MLPSALLLAATNNLDWVSVANVSYGPGPILALFKARYCVQRPKAWPGTHGSVSLSLFLKLLR